jgi:hypothetical protein
MDKVSVTVVTHVRDEYDTQVAFGGVRPFSCISRRGHDDTSDQGICYAEAIAAPG